MKYQLRMYYADAANQTAGSKATRDCSMILSDLGYRHFDVPVYSNKSPLLNLLTLLKHIGKLYDTLRPGDQVLLQYPLLGINKWLKFFVAILKSKDCRLICLLHDLDSLRHVHHAWTLEQEIERLNAFDLVIVHNERMKAMLLEKGLTAAMSCLGLFDYLVPERVFLGLQHRSYAADRGFNQIAFAGNLGKSVFLKGLQQISGLRFMLYGPGYEQLQASDHLFWAGCFDADELPLALDADFGLIWDGDAADACTGHLGQYLKYNNPHKASLYLLAGLPLIAPANTAIGDFIRLHGLGITVESLLELPEVLQRLSKVEYAAMRDAVRPISAQLAAAAFLRQALAAP